MKSALGVFGLWGGGTAVAVFCFWLLAGVATRAPSAASQASAGTSAYQQAIVSAPTSTVGSSAITLTSPPTPPTALPVAPPSTAAIQVPTAVPTQVPPPTPPPPTAAPTNTAAAPTNTAVVPAAIATQSVQAPPTATSGAVEQPSPEQLAASPGSYVGHRVIVNGAVERCVQEARWYTCQVHEGSASGGREYYVVVRFDREPPGVQPGVGVGVTGMVAGTEQLPGSGADGPVVPVVHAEQVAVGN